MSSSSTVRTRLDTAVTRLVPPLGVSITIPGITSYITTGVRATMNKSSDTSVLQVVAASSGFQTTAVSQFYAGVRVFGPGHAGGTTVDLGVFYFNTANEHMLSGHIKELTGYAVGTYVFELLLKLANASTVQQLDWNDIVQLCVIETEQ